MQMAVLKNQMKLSLFDALVSLKCLILSKSGWPWGQTRSWNFEYKKMFFYYLQLKLKFFFCHLFILFKIKCAGFSFLIKGIVCLCYIFIFSIQFL